MASGLNKVLIIGNLGHEPELRYTNSGQAVLSLRIASNERVKIRDEWQDKVEWHSVVIWAKRAEALSKIIHKGTQMFVEGRLQTRPWEDKDGNKRYTTEIVAREVILLGGKNGNGNRNSAPPPDDGDYYGCGSSSSSGGGGYPDDDSDIPF